MAARGANAKTAVEKKIAEAFGSDFIGVYDKKLYVWANDGGERVQIAINLTCPKTAIGEVEQVRTSNELNFEEMSSPMDMTKEERENIERLKRELNL